MPHISLIVATFNRSVSLSHTLASITAAINASPELVIEVLIADNGSTDDTQHVIAVWREHATFPIQTIIETTPGVSAARNAALKRATSPIMAMTDDDCRLNLDYFTVLYRHYSADTTPVFRGGRVELGTPEDLAFSIKTGEHIIRMNDITAPGGFLMGANMIVTREIVDRIGYFDTDFGGGASFGAAEDSDYVYRAYCAGFVVEYVPDVIVQHFHGRRNFEAIARLNYGYHVGNGALYAKNFTHLHLWRHFYWDVRKAFKELLGGEKLYPDLGLSYYPLVLGNIKGFALYVTHKAKNRLRRSEVPHDPAK